MKRHRTKRGSLIETKENNVSWYSTGEDAEKFADKKAEEQAAEKVWRFWMKPGDSQYITFIDEDVHPSGFKLPFVFMEHQLHLNGSWRNWFTCIQGMPVLDEEGNPVTDEEGRQVKQVCPLCKGGDKPALVAAYSVIDHSEWTSKDGTVHKDERKLYVVKSKVLKVLRKAAAKKDGLRGWYVEVSRTDDMSPNTGDQFDFEKRGELDPKIVPADYLKEFEPKSYADLMAIIGGAAKEQDDTVRF